MKTQNSENEKHTPGPWKQHATFIWSASAKANIAALSSLRASHVVEYIPPEIGDEHLEEIYANGRLISAAPDLLEALKGIESFAQQQIDDLAADAQAGGKLNHTELDRWSAVGAAISKARGQQ